MLQAFKKIEKLGDAYGIAELEDWKLRFWSIGCRIGVMV